MTVGIGPSEPLLRLEPGEPGSRRLFLTRSVPDEEQLFEVVGGRFAPKRLTVYDTVVGNNVLGELSWRRPPRVDRVVYGVLFDLPNAENFYRPEVAVVPRSCWPPTRPLPDGEAWSAVPELVVEVVGRQRANENHTGRIRDYFRAGVSQVWVVLTETAEVHVHSSPTTVRVLTRADELTGDPVVPGFRLPVADLFPPSAPSP